MRRLLVPLMGLVLLGSSACGSGTDGTESSGGGSGVEAGANGNAEGGELGGTVPKCPFTAAQVSDMVGQSMKDEGNCAFGDGKGVASLTITMSSEFAASMTYDYERNLAKETYREVKDIDKGKKGFLAIKDIEAQAVVVSPAGSYVLTLSSFESLRGGGYEQTLRKLLDALPL